MWPFADYVASAQVFYVCPRRLPHALAGSAVRDRLVKVLRESDWVDGSSLVIERRKVGSDNELAKREAAKSARHCSNSVRLVRYFCLAEAATGMPR